MKIFTLAISTVSYEINDSSSICPTNISHGQDVFALTGVSHTHKCARAWSLWTYLLSKPILVMAFKKGIKILGIPNCYLKQMAWKSRPSHARHQDEVGQMVQVLLLLLLLLLLSHYIHPHYWCRGLFLFSLMSTLSSWKTCDLRCSDDCVSCFKSTSRQP